MIEVYHNFLRIVVNEKLFASKPDGEEIFSAANIKTAATDQKVFLACFKTSSVLKEGAAGRTEINKVDTFCICKNTSVNSIRALGIHGKNDLTAIFIASNAKVI